MFGGGGGDWGRGEQRDRGERGERARDVEGQGESRRRKDKAGEPPGRASSRWGRGTVAPAAFPPPLSSPHLSSPPSPPSHLRLVLLQQPARARPAGVVGHVQDHHALLLPADEGAVRQALHHRQEVLVAVVARAHHGEGRPVVLLQHLEDHLQLQRRGGAELQEDGARFLIWLDEERRRERRREQQVWFKNRTEVEHSCMLADQQQL